MRFLRSEMKVCISLSKGTVLLLTAFVLQRESLLSWVVKRAMAEHWTTAVKTPDAQLRQGVDRVRVSLKLRPALAVKVRTAVGRNRSALVERCCLLYLEGQRRQPSPSNPDDGSEQQQNGDPSSSTSSLDA
jgi:hypothetical protein